MNDPVSNPSPAAPARKVEFHLVFIVSSIIFLMCLFFVFFGFVGYFSRVNLNSEFQKSDQNIDYVFMMVDQIVRDEREIAILRSRFHKAGNQAQENRLRARAESYLTDEYTRYVEILLKLQDFLNANRDSLNAEYWQRFNRVNFDEPDAEVGRALSSLRFKEGVDSKKMAEIETFVIPAARQLQVTIVNYFAKHGARLQFIDEIEKATSREVSESVRAILNRNPQLGHDEEFRQHDIKPLDNKEREQRSMVQQRAILRSYDDALGGLGGFFLRLPTIVSTLVVTLATGLLGGLVSFMGAAVVSQREPSVGHIQESQIVSLFRRSFLGITAALGIFLFFGSGLLVLTAQSGKAVGPNSLELSPYFVAFLAFISGFLADDAFGRLTMAGQAIFQSADLGAAASSATHTDGATARQQDDPTRTK